MSSSYITTVLLGIGLHIRELFTTLSTRYSGVDMVIRSEVHVIWQNIAQHLVSTIIWIAGSQNVADSGKKTDSLLSDVRRLCISTRFWAFSFLTIESVLSSRYRWYMALSMDLLKIEE